MKPRVLITSGYDVRVEYEACLPRIGLLSVNPEIATNFIALIRSHALTFQNNELEVPRGDRVLRKLADVRCLLTPHRRSFPWCPRSDIQPADPKEIKEERRR